MDDSVKTPKRKGRAYALPAAFLILFIALLLAFPLFIQKHYLSVSLCLMAASFLPLMIRFEWKKMSGREIVILAVLGAVAALSRVPFASLPSVQPTTFVVILTGAVFGAESGFAVGALAALVSNIFLGQGPWTPWQMYGWGMIGWISGLLRSSFFIKNSFGRGLFGFLSGFAFNWLMNLWVILTVLDHWNWKGIAAIYGASFFFDLAHALSNVFFLAVFSNSWMKILLRMKKKYGLLEAESDGK
jgi:energy-coupling factor transport system substrate-specific component